MNLTQIETELKEAADGLLMMSETDAPFEFYLAEDFTAEDLNEESVLQMAAMPADYPLEVVELDYFFRNMTKENQENQQTAKRFQHLQSKLKELLQDVKVYRIGESQIMVLILGKTPEGKIAGLKTMLVET